jgi:U3 small nucleolar RNA-associated protein 22
MNRVVLFAATNLDEEGTTWTDKAMPEKVVASRLTALAKAAAAAVRADEDRLLKHINALATKDNLTPDALFIPNTTDFDIVISINSKYTRHSDRKRKSEPLFKNLDLQKLSSPANVPASKPLPQLFAEELQAVYGDAVLWFWDPETLGEIVGLWNPLVTQQRGWKVKLGWNSTPIKGKGGEEVRVGVNKEAVLWEVRRLGGELVRGVEARV